jgi:hypothetical protein
LPKRAGQREIATRLDTKTNNGTKHMKTEQIIKVGGARGSRPKAVALTGLLVLVGLALGTWEYGRQRAETIRYERDLAVSAKLAGALYLDSLLHLITEGKVDEAKQGLSFRLAGELSAIRSLQLAADEETRSLAQGVCRAIVRTEMAHPAYYLSAAPEARFYQTQTWHDIRVAMFGPLTTPLEPAREVSAVGQAGNP